MRCLRVTISFSALISLALTFGLGVQKADAGACKKMGLSHKCVTTGDIRPGAVTNGRIRKNTIRLNRMDDSVAGLNGNGMVKAWAKINADGTIASCWRCNITPIRHNGYLPVVMRWTSRRFRPI